MEVVPNLHLEADSVRSRIMSRIQGENTGPEIYVRKLLSINGYRYRLHDRAIPGSPDIVLKRLLTIIFVNGCFWHGHDCRGTRLPKSNRKFWSDKIKRNRARDARNLAECRQLGWSCLVIWKCALRGKSRLSEERLRHEIIAWLEREVKQPSVKQIKGRKLV